MNKPLISIIIATFNAEKYLTSCLNSIKAQINIFEIIVIDGNSSDKTFEIIESYKEHIAYYISEYDNGIYDAWNKGIKQCRGKWIMFLGADDQLLPNAIKDYSDFINRHNTESIDLISSKAQYVDNKDNLISIIGSKWTWPNFKYSMLISHPGALHSRKLFASIGCFNSKYKICGDYDLLLRKKDKLKTLFLESLTVSMKTGGVSYSTKAIKETNSIRLSQGIISRPKYLFLILKELFIFKTHTLRFSMRKNLILILSGAIFYFINNLISQLPSHHLRNFFLKVMKLKKGQNTRIYGGFEFRNPWNIKIGNHTNIGHKVTLDGRAGIDIGDCVNISSEVMIWTWQHDYNDPNFKTTHGKVIIEDYAWLSARVIVLPGIRIGKGAVIAAGAVVTKDVDPFSLYGGIPAKKIGTRNRNLKYKLGKDYLHFA